MNKTKEFDYKEFEQDALSKLKRGVSLEGENDILAPLLERLLEAGLQGELEGHLSQPAELRNRRNELSSKKVKTHYGNIEVSTPRDRNGSFEPELLAKRQTTLGEGLDHKIISLYALGMS